MNGKIISGLLLFVSVLFIRCNTQKGYSDLDELSSDFVQLLIESDEEKLKAFSYKVTPDEGTVEYMKKNDFSYGGFPEGLEKEDKTLSDIADEYYYLVWRFRQRLKKNRLLDNLKYIGRESNEEFLYDERLGIYASTTIVLMESGGDTVRFKLGDMFKINGKWKSFSKPFRF